MKKYYIVNFLSLDASKDAMVKQAKVIKEIANEGNCVIVGRAADYILKDNPNLIKGISLCTFRLSYKQDKRNIQG